MRILKHFAVAILIFVSSYSIAQKEMQSSFMEGSNSYHFVFNTEYNFNYNYNLSALLDSRGIPSFEDKPLVFGAGLNYILDRAVVRFDFNINYRKSNQDGYLAKQRVNVIGMTYGYNLLKSNSWIISPYVGARVRLFNYKYTEKLEGFSFDQVLDYNPNDISIRYSKVYLDCGLSFAHQSFHHVEVRAGYNVPLTKNKWWDANRVNSFSGISNYLTGFYVRLSIGIGSKGIN